MTVACIGVKRLNEGKQKQTKKGNRKKNVIRGEIRFVWGG